MPDFLCCFQMYNAIYPNLPNLLTAARMPAIFLIILLMLLPWPGMATLALIIFIAASATDWLDGYIARKLRVVSRLGKFMDALIDKVFVISMLAALLTFQILPAWTLPLVIIITAREFLITGLRMLAARAGKTIAADTSGKFKMIFQLVSIGLLLSVRSAVTDGGWASGDFLIQFIFWLGIATFLVATLLTVTSGVHYIVRYWHLITSK